MACVVVDALGKGTKRRVKYARFVSLSLLSSILPTFQFHDSTQPDPTGLDPTPTPPLYPQPQSQSRPDSGTANLERGCNPLRLREELLRERMRPQGSSRDLSGGAGGAGWGAGTAGWGGGTAATGSKLIVETLLPRLAGELLPSHCDIMRSVFVVFFLEL